jgi:hypothetical protein
VGDVTGDVTGRVFNGDADLYTTVTPAIATTATAVFLGATTQGVAATLAAGTAGQIMYIKAINVDNAVTLTPAIFSDGTSITFGTVDMYITLLYSGVSWFVIGGDATVNA